METLLKAKRPVIFVGEELQASGGSREVVRLAELLGAPVVTGDGAKGAFPEDHPLSLGPALGRRIWGDNPVQEWLGTCDVAVVLGSALTYRTTAGVGLKLPETIIHVLLDSEIVGKNYPTTVSIEADSGAVVRQWLEAIGDRDVYTGTPTRRHRGHSERMSTRACRPSGATSCAPSRPSARWPPGTPFSPWTRP